MKCPSCQFECSELRQNCPKCDSKLHQQKSTISYLGLLDPGEDISKILDQIIEDTYLASSTLKQRKTGELGDAPATPSTNTATEIGPAAMATSEIITSSRLELPPTIALSSVPNSAELNQEDLAKESNPGIALVFSDALRDILSSSKTIDFEVGFEQLVNSQANQETILLFDIAFEWIADPLTEKTSHEKILASDEREIEASGLVHELKKVEERINAPVLTLKHAAHARAAHPTNTENQEAANRTFDEASLAPRLTGFLVDCLAILTISAFILLVPLWLSDPSFWPRLLDADAKIVIDLPPVIAAFLALVVFCSAIYPALLFSLFGTTLGTWVTKLRLGTLSGRRAKQSHILLRCLSFPLSLALLGFLPLLFGKRALHDYMSGTTFFRYYSGPH